MLDGGVLQRWRLVCLAWRSGTSRDRLDSGLRDETSVAIEIWISTGQNNGWDGSIPGYRGAYSMKCTTVDGF
jgi:hypothetical protein